MTKCTAEGCGKSAAYGVDYKNPLRCGQHKQVGDEDVKHARCCHKGCKKPPNFGPEYKAIACKLHKEGEWKDVLSKLCESPGCRVAATFGLKGGRPKRCATHKLATEINIVTKRCQHDDCDKYPAYGPSGTKRPLTCRAHSEGDWILLRSRYCHEPCCGKSASFGIETGKPVSCMKHKLPEHRNVVNSTCFFEGCSTTPVFGPDTKAIACKLHRQEGWRDVKSKRCEHPGCDTMPRFGDRGSSRVCKAHNINKWPNVYKKRCQHPNCSVYPLFGIEWKRPTHCCAHKSSDMTNVVNCRCSYEGCNVRVYQYTLCANHDTTHKRRTRVRENQIANLLRESASIPWSSWNKELEDSRACTGRAYRPDFLYDLDTHVLAVEADEMQHFSYECDRSRMVDIWNACGGAPVTFVRYNPDGFKLAGKKSSADTATRHKLLVREVEKALAGKQQHLLTVIKLFFDNDQDDFVQRSWIDVNDHRFTETSIAN